MKLEIQANETDRGKENTRTKEGRRKEGVIKEHVGEWQQGQRERQKDTRRCRWSAVAVLVVLGCCKLLISSLQGIIIIIKMEEASEELGGETKEKSRTSRLTNPAVKGISTTSLWYNSSDHNELEVGVGV